MQKYANLVHLEKCCQFLQNFVLIQPRTSPPKICIILLILANFPNFASPNSSWRTAVPAALSGAARGLGGLGGVPRRRRGRRAVGGGRGATAGGDRSVKIKSLKAAKLMKIKCLVLGCVEADVCN